MAGFYSCLRTNKSCMAMTTSTEEQPEALESEEAGDAFSGKKKSKFQNFKKFFAKKKKSKDLPSLMEESQLRPSQACSDGGSAQAEAILLHPPTETEPNGSTGNQGLLHDSESAPETLCDVAGEAPLQENFPGKVKDFEQNPCLEPPLVMTTDKRMNDGDTVSEDDSLPGSLLELSTIHDILLSSTTLVASVGSPKHDSSLPAGSPVSPLGHALLVDFNSPASPLGCLDTSAARHRIAMNPRKQRGFAKKSHHLLVEQRLPEPDEEKGGPSEFLEEAASWRKVPEGLLDHHVVNVNDDETDSASPGTGTSEALPSSHSPGLQGDGACILVTDVQNLPETQLQLSSTLPSPNVPSSLIKGKEGQKMDDEEKKGTCPLMDDQKPQSGSDVTENSESFPLKTRVTGLHRASPLLESKTGKKLVAEDIEITCSERTDIRANVSKPARNRHKACDRSVCGDGSVSLETDSVLPQLSSSALKVSSDATKDFMHKNRFVVNENGRGPSDMELQTSPGPGKPTDSLQGALFKLEVDPSRPALLNPAVKKPRLQLEDSTLRELGSLPSGRPSAVGSAEVASKTCLPGVQLGNVLTKEESNATEKIKTQAKTSSAKPVRFTIAPAWQRSLSGGSSSVDSSCPRNSPTSPVRPELFEGVSPLDAESQILISPERLDKGNRNTTVSLNSSPEEAPNCESPFGVKLRRTSSMLKYQTGHHWDPPKPVSLVDSSPSSVKIEPKSSNYGTSLQNLTTGVKSFGVQEKNPPKIKSGEGGTKPQASKPSEQIPVVFSGRSAIQSTWISGAKQKQHGSQDEASAKGQKKREEAVAQTGKEEVKLTSASHLEQQVTLTGDSSSKKSVPHQNVRLLESKVLLKSAPLAAKEGPARILPQEGPRLEKDTRLPPILPLASCSSTEPPWLSLAKKKAKAWSEMPQTVQ